LLLKLSGNRLAESFIKLYKGGWIQTQVTLPDWGIWQLYWVAMLENGEGIVPTPQSSRREIDCEHPNAKQARAKLPGFLLHAKKLRGRLLAASKEFRSSSTSIQSQQQELEKYYWNLHHLISKSRFIANEMWRAFEEIGYGRDEALEKNKELEELFSCIDACCMRKAELDDQMQHNQKKLSLKSFKHSVASLVEEGTLTDWIGTIQEQDIINTGGEVNRLYQLLTEGKKANSLLLDSTTLMKASERSDLFSAKQCQFLKERSGEIEAKMVEETRRLLKDQAELELQERKLQEMKTRAQIMPLRTTVVLYNLVKRSDLNGATGIYMGLGEGERYIVRVNGIDMALLSSNFKEWKDDSPQATGVAHRGPSLASASWSCSICTLVHDGKDAILDECACCGHARNSYVPRAAAIGREQHQTAPPTQKPTAVSGPAGSWKERAQHQPLATQSQKPASTNGPVASAKRPVQKVAKEPSLGTKIPSEQTQLIKAVAWIQPDVVPAFIGRKGSNVKEMAAKSGARMYVDRKTSNEQGCYAVQLEGKQVDIDRALMCIRDFLHNIDNNKGIGHKNGQTHTTRTKKTSNKTLDKKHDRPRNRSDTPSTAAVSVPESISIMASATEEEASTVTDALGTSPPAKFGSSSDVDTMDVLFLFVLHQASCLKCKAEVFYNFLREQDIANLSDLNEAVRDEDFMMEMQGAGLKGFKKAAFKRAVASAVNDSDLLLGVETVDNGLSDGKPPAGNQHFELECPICFEFMTTDPVMAADGFTYERHAIEGWFRRHQDDPNGIRSPKTNLPMQSLALMPNIQMRTMARDAAARAEG